jgi:hypothetical protein
MVANRKSLELTFQTPEGCTVSSGLCGISYAGNIPKEVTPFIHRVCGYSTVQYFAVVYRAYCVGSGRTAKMELSMGGGLEGCAEGGQ